MDIFQIKGIKCPACKRELIEIQREDNSFVTCKVCINENCPLHIDLSKKLLYLESNLKMGIER
jgi:hypothetical protein